MKRVCFCSGSALVIIDMIVAVTVIFFCCRSHHFFGHSSSRQSPVVEGDHVSEGAVNTCGRKQSNNKNWPTLRQIDRSNNITMASDMNAETRGSLLLLLLLLQQRQSLQKCSSSVAIRTVSAAVSVFQLFLL